MNEKQRDGMERAGETGDIIDRRAGERRAAAPVVAVVAAGIKTWQQRQAASEYRRTSEVCMMDEITDLRAALASQAQAAPSAPTCEAAWAEYVGKRHPMLDTSHNRNIFAAGFAAQAAVSAPVDFSGLDASRCQGYSESCMEGGGVYKDDEGPFIRRTDAQAIMDEFKSDADLAAQAAVGVASQQEQQPQPSCMPPFAAPASPQDAPEPGDSDSLADRVFNLPCKWAGDQALESAVMWGHTIACEQAYRLVWAHEQTRTAGSAKGGITNNSGAASPDLASIASQAQGDQLDTLLPCNITVGQTTYAKGIVLRSLVNHAQQLYTAANSRVDPKQLLANVAGWYAEKGYLLGKDDVPAAIRALCPTPTES